MIQIRSIILATAITTSSLALSACTSTDLPVSLAPPYAPLIDGEAVPVVPHPDPASLLRSEDPQLAANKRMVWDMWRTVVNGGHVEMADEYLTENYIQHNPMANTGRAAFKQYFSAAVPRRDSIPEAVEEPVVSIVAEGDYVVMAFVTEYDEPDGSGTYTSTHFDMFRFENGKIAEHWDSIQRPAGFSPTPASQGGPLPVIGVSGAAQLPMLRSSDSALMQNKRLVFDLWRQLPEAGREEIAELYVDPIYIQHNPNAATGRAGMVEYFSRRPDTPIDTFLEDPLVALVAEGDLVVQVLQEERPDPVNPDRIYYVAWFDMFRVQDGKLIEHWDTASKGELPAIMQQTP